MTDWGTATFDNDAASRWIEAFVAEPSADALQQVFDQAEDARVDVDLAHAVLSAAEVVAAWCGRPAPDLPVNLTPWLMGRSQALPRELVGAAKDAVLVIGRDSHLREQWRERQKLEAWESELLALVERLGTHL